MDENENEGLSTGKKVVAGAAIGVAVPAAVGVAKKLMGDGDAQDDARGGTGRSKKPGSKSASGRATGSGRSRGSTTKRRTGASAKGASGGSTRSGSSNRSSGTRARSSSSSSSRRSAGSSGGGSSRTKEQLYNQAKRLGIEGRSSMTKAQLERAVSRARS
jgi:hypothetical protein